MTAVVKVSGDFSELVDGKIDRVEIRLTFDQINSTRVQTTLLQLQAVPRSSDADTNVFIAERKRHAKAKIQ